ncbi:MAG TPA: hypothetical protein VFO89_15785, partial [Thermoanaerobaculia bacterium]|nr:hypothetical protein [Thermoanaerobaculia bacterium]
PRFEVFLLLTFCITAIATAQTPPAGDLERVLVPVHTVPTPGPGGALWQTELWIVTDASEAFVGPFRNRECPPATCGPPPPPPPPPNEAFQPPVFRARPGEASGILLYVRRPLSKEVTFALRIADTSRRALSEGTTIPVVRERDFIRDRPAHLLNIPAAASSRVRLRVYDPFLIPNAAVVVRLYRANGPDLLLHEETLILRQPEPHPELLWPLPLQPAIGEINIRTDIAGVTDGDVLRIEVSPITEDLAFWALATITNNVTNEVTISIPN